MTHQVICFGEILWDILPGKSLPGGAPMNVAFHLKKHGLNTALITKIGLDDRGQKLVKISTDNNLTTDYFQVDSEHPTGAVYAKLHDNNEVSYDIVFPSAWDYIDWNDEFDNLLSSAKYIVYGSLACRN